MKNALLMQEARQALTGRWFIAIGAVVLNVLTVSIASAAVPGFGLLVSLLITGPMSLGLATFFLDLSCGKKISIGQIFDGFKIYSKAESAYLLMVLFVFLWSLLFIIPGIIASLAYAMTFFIISDNPSLSASEALKESKRIMKGNKWKLFCLHLRFIGWILLAAIFTLGIGMLWVIPYMQVAVVKFYDDLKADKEN